MKLLPVTFFVLLAYAKPIPPGAELDKLQKSWDAAATYQSTFHQTVTAKRLGTRDESSGTLYVAKPSRLRWESKTDGTIQIMNGKRLTVIQHNRRRGTTVVDIYADAGKVLDAKPLAFLSGKAKFADIYKVEVLHDGPRTAEMRFVPKGDPAEALVAEIDKSGYLLRALISETLDSDSRVRTEFSDTKTNVKLDDKLFEYKPNASDVVHNN